MSLVSSQFVHVCISTVFGHALFPLASRIFNLSVCKFYHRSSWQPHSTCLHPPKIIHDLICSLASFPPSISWVLQFTRCYSPPFFGENSPCFPQLQPSTQHFCWEKNRWIHSGSALHGEPIAPRNGELRRNPPRNADPRGPAPISGAPAAEAEGRAAGLSQGRTGGENPVPKRPKFGGLRCWCGQKTALGGMKIHWQIRYDEMKNDEHRDSPLSRELRLPCGTCKFWLAVESAAHVSWLAGQKNIDHHGLQLVLP